MQAQREPESLTCCALCKRSRGTAGTSLRCSAGTSQKLLLSSWGSSLTKYLLLWEGTRSIQHEINPGGTQGCTKPHFWAHCLRDESDSGGSSLPQEKARISDGSRRVRFAVCFGPNPTKPERCVSFSPSKQCHHSLSCSLSLLCKAAWPSALALSLTVMP